MNRWAQENVFFRRLIMTVIVVAAALLIWNTLHIFLLIFLGIILAVFLRKSGLWFSSMARIPEGLGISMVIIALGLCAVAAITFMAPQIVAQVGELSRLIPSSWQQLKQSVSHDPLGGWFIQNLPSLQGVSGVLGGLMHQATAWLYSAFGLVTSAVIIVILGIFFAFDANLYVQGIAGLFPSEKRKGILTTLQGLGSTLYWWLLGRLISMVIIGLMTVLGLWLLGIPLVLTLGTFAAVMTFIPNLGPIISVIPAALLALQVGWAESASVVGLYAGIQVVESNLVTPFVQKRMVAIPPGLILSAQIVMGVLQGALGILIATPLTGSLMVLTKQLYIQDVLGEDPKPSSAPPRNRK